MKELTLWHTTDLDNSFANFICNGASQNKFEELGFFCLKTCQRLILINRNKTNFSKLRALVNNQESMDQVLGQEKCFHQFTGPSAYQFLLETVCGLKSRLIGENEIVAQFKDSFQEYLNADKRDASLIKIFHKIVIDSKKIRSTHLQKIGLLSYCGLTKHTLNKYFGKCNLNQTPVSILGSGKLADDLIKVLGRHYKITIHARNKSALQNLEKKYADYKHNINITSAIDLQSLHQQPIILNTIAADSVIFKQHFFDEWKNYNSKKNLFIDLSSPSIIETTYKKSEAVYRLNDLFQIANTLQEQKDEKVQSAMQTIEEMTARRMAILSPGFQGRWEEFQFA